MDSNPPELAKRTILLTGGCGYLGSNFIRYWRNQYPKDTIIVLDALTYAGRLSNVFSCQYKLDMYEHKGWVWDSYISEFLPNLRVIHGKIEDYNILRAIVEGFSPDLVVNMAAESHVDNSLVNALPFIRTNVEGTLQVLNICKDKRLPLIHISTDEVLDHHYPIKQTEDAILGPKNPYAASKASAEMLCQAYRANFDMDITVVRPTNLIGPENQHKEKFLPKAITNLLSGAKVPLYGEGLEVRNWLWVMDCCKALDLIINLPVRQHVYHIAPDNEIANVGILQMILDKLKISWEDGVELVPNRTGHDPYYGLYSGRLRSLGWAPTPLEQVLDITLSYYKELQLYGNL